jgi:hypothetical protein
MAFVVMPALAADDDTHTGKIVSAGDNKLVMTDNDTKKEMTHTVAADALITLDGKAAKLEDLKKGITVKVTTKKDDKKVAVAIAASTKDDKK